MNGAIKITIKYKNPFFIKNQVIIKMAVDNRNELDGYLIILCPVDIPLLLLLLLLYVTV